MKQKKSRRLVIDASVARASGGPDTVNRTSKHCRDFLLAVLRICHRIVMTNEIYAEWQDHQSGFARTWLRTMVAKKKLCKIRVDTEQTFHDKIIGDSDNPGSAAAMRKDIHLLTAAIASDKAIASLDETVRKLFHDQAHKATALREIVWVNPAIESENSVDWLESGAKSEITRCLGTR